MQPEIFLPTLSSMEYGNVWTGSQGDMRFKVVPDPKAGEMNVEVWHGPLCYECSQITETAQFPLTQEGIGQLRSWLAQRT